MGNAEDNGIFVKAAGNDGVVVSSASDDGVYVNTSADDGLRVGLAESGDGLQVDNAPLGHGVHVYTAGLAGVQVDEAGNDGFFVCTTGSATSCTVSGTNSGLEVGNAQHYGVHVKNAGDDGLHVDSASDDGVYVGFASGDGLYIDGAAVDGVRVNSAGEDGVDARTSFPSGYGGRFSNGSADGGGVYAIGGGNDAADLVLGGTAGGDDGRIYSEPSLTGSDIWMFSNDNFYIDLDEDGGNSSAFKIFSGTGVELWSISESGLAVADQGSAAAVDAGGDEKQLVYAVHSPQNWLEDFGSGQMVGGEAVVALDGTFASVISLDEAYHVFLTPLGDCSLYVAEKGATSFTVRALGGQACDVGFDYRIVALRRGYETVRMQQFSSADDG